MCQARPDANFRYFLDFVRTAVAVIAVFANALTTGHSQAGETTGDSATDKQSKSANDAERVMTADSNIPTAEEVGDNPVFSMSRDFIEKSGERQTAELLRDLPFANANGIPVSNNGDGFTPGAASVSLRGFTPEATLVLIDGRRIASYPMSDASGRTFQDLFSIQLSAVQSIEILKDGCFITSGANAVAGVVNLKFWKDYRGTQVTLDYGNTLDKDAAIYQGDILFGVGDDYVNITGDIFFYHHDSLFNRDRGNSVITPAFRSPNSSPFNLQLADAVVVAAGGSPASPGNPIGFAHAPFFSNGLAPASQYVYTAARSSLFNFQQFNGSYPEQERYGGYTAFNDKICEDQVQLYGDFYYAKVKTNNELAPAGTGSFFTPGQTTIAIPPHSPLSGLAPPNTPRFVGEAGSGPGGALSAGENPTGVPADAFNPFNPFNQIISGGSRARLAEFGNRIEDDTTEAYVTTLGVKGDRLLDGNWGYDAGLRYSEIENDRSRQQVSASRFNRILNAADPIFDPTSDQFIGTTTPYNPFGDYRVPITSNIPSINFATVHSKELDVSKLTELNLQIYTTELFKLPAGGVGLAFGAEFRRESIEQDPDQLELEHDIIAPSPRLSILPQAGRKDYAVFGETRVPLFSPEMGVIGLHSLELTAGLRFEEFLSNDSNVLVPRVGVRWAPFDEQLTIHSSWTEGFSEPSLFQLYGLPALGVVPFRFHSIPEPETVFAIGSNRNLQPEDSRTWTGGATYTPKWLPWGAMTLWLNLWDIERTGTIGTPSAQELVRRLLNGRSLLPGEDVQIDPATGAIEFIRTGFQNIGRQSARGVDMALLYQFLAPLGVVTLSGDWAYLDQFVLQQSTGSFGRDRVGQAADQFSNEGWYRWKGNTRIDWTWHNFDLNASWRYVGGFREIIKNSLVNNPGFPNGVHEHWTNPTNFIDAQASYSLIFTPPQENDPVAGYSNAASKAIKSKDGKTLESTATYLMPCWRTILNNSTITIGCNNIFGQDPPKAFGFFSGNSINYPGFTYDNIGRFWYVELTKKF